MKILFLTACASLWLTSPDAQPTIGASDTLHSRILKESRVVWIHLPASAGNNKKKYPVVYLMDGDKNFTGVVGMVDLLSSVNGNAFWPEMIVVGILNTDRKRDLTPTKVTSGLWIDADFAKSSGGGESFMAFIERELIPHIDSLYPTTRYRMLIGHSLGGLTVINTLVHHKNLFNSYVAIEPSMWWDQQRLLHETEGALRGGDYGGIALFLAMAHTQDAGMDTTMVQRDSTDGTFHPRSILQLSRYINQYGLETEFKYYDKETHASVPLIATYDALHFIFKDYPFELKDDYIGDSTFQLAAFLQVHFDHISGKYGLAQLPPENMVDGLGWLVLRKKQFRKAEELFRLDVKNYPESARARESLRQLFEAMGKQKEN